MKQNWEYKKLGECGMVITGNTPSKKDAVNYSSNDFCFVKPNDIEKDGITYINQTCEYISKEAFEKSRRLPKKSVLTTCIGIIGKVAILEVDAICNQQINAIIPNKGVDSKFLAYSILSIRNFLTQKANAPVVPIINKGDFSDVSIPVPPLTEQSRIVAELDLLTGIINKQKAQLKELDNLAQSIFYDMFGDPIENPKGWDVKKLGDMSSSVSYGTSLPSSPNGKYKYLRMNNITYDGFLDLTDLKYIDVDDDEFEKYSVREGDILFNRTNSMDLIGKTTYIHGMEPMIIAGYIIRVRVVDSIMPVFVSKFMNTPAMKKKLRGMAKGAVNQANINSKELKSIDIILPPLKLQQDFADKIASIEKQKSAINQSIAETQKLLDYTMDKYFG